MDIAENLRRIGGVNTGALSEYVSKLSDASWHQDLPVDGGQIIRLVYDDELRHDKPTKQPALEYFSPVLQPILAVVARDFDESDSGRTLTAKYGQGYFVRAGLLRIVSGASCRLPKADSVSEKRSHRIHVSVVADRAADITVGDTTIGMPAGEIYEINNFQDARIDNRGHEECVHLVLDYVLDRGL